MKIPPATYDGGLDPIIEVLSREFAGTFSWGTVARIVEDTAARWCDVPITSFVPTFTHRFARERLRAVALVGGYLNKDVPQVLFVCDQNAGHSQMAAALLAHRAQGRLSARSAGWAPAPRIYHQVLKVMDEVKIDLAEEFPKPLSHEMVRAADVVITLGCGDVCPIYPHVRYLDWNLRGPAGKELEELRSVRDEIDARVRGFLPELLEG